jgi:hypothetical protein
MLHLRFHPAWQFLVTLLAFYVLYLGFARFRILHLGHKTDFKWKRHVNLGYIVLGGWLLGGIGGFALSAVTWPGWLITGWHGYVGVLMTPFLVFGIISGMYMDRKKKKRKLLPLLHGLNNLFLLLLALLQAWTGYWVSQMFLAGG